MGQFKITKGLNIPLAGEPEKVIEEKLNVKSVGLIGPDYIGMKPTMEVQVGDYVKLGQVIFTDKKMPGVKFTAPGCGKVTEVNRGDKRAFQSIVIELDGNDEVSFESFSEADLNNLTIDKVKEILIESGQWTSLRSRPFEKVANPADMPHSIFVTAMDTNPLSLDYSSIIKEKEKDFNNGLTVLSHLTEGKINICKSPETQIEITSPAQTELHDFSGVHPAGNVGTHIHFIEPVGRKKQVWHINAQEVIAIGQLFTTGKLSVERIVALSGPSANKPRYIKTRLGANLLDLIEGEKKDGDHRVISGSALSGRLCEDFFNYLGRYHYQMVMLEEEKERKFLGWLSPGFNLFSVKGVVLSTFFGAKNLELGTGLNGDKRAIVPIGSYEKVMPLDILATYLLRSLAVDDIEEAEKLGCLELSEEDLALCTFVCQSKNDYGSMLRRNLTKIEKEG